jgi:hypothetical protein
MISIFVFPGETNKDDLMEKSHSEKNLLSISGIFD